VAALYSDCIFVQSACLASWGSSQQQQRVCVLVGGGGSWGKNVV
jgi:hypothetical protein